MFKEFQEEDIMPKIYEIIEGYGELLSEFQQQSIYNYYKQAYYSNAKDYSELDRKTAKDFILRQIEFLANESYDEKRYKAKLINKFGFETWLSWIFGKVRLSFVGASTKIKSINGAVKEKWIDKRKKELSEGLGGSIISEATTYEESLINMIA